MDIEFLEMRWTSWEKLAKKHNLQFTLDQASNQPQISGIYRNRQLSLRIAKKNYSGTQENYTQISLSSNHSDNHTPVSLTIDEVDELLFPSRLSQGLWERLLSESAGQKIVYEKPGIEVSIRRFEFLFDWLSNIAESYSGIIALGSSVIPYIYKLVEHDSRLKPFGTQILRDIAQDTTNRLGLRRFRCLHCLAQSKEYNLRLSWHETLTYYGCRICGQSQDFTQETAVVVTLDNQVESELCHQEGNTLRVDWLLRRKLFDFDSVEIVEASDEDVERFAVQVGNDTDSTRASRYKHMHCLVYPDCQLTDNTLRILRKTFGQVKIAI